MSVVFVLHSQVARALRSSILLATAPHSQPVVASSSPSSAAAHSETKLCKQKEAFAGVFRFDIVALGPTTLCHLSQRPQFDCCVWLTESWVAQFPTISYYPTLSVLYTIYTDIYYIHYIASYRVWVVNETVWISAFHCHSLSLALLLQVGVAPNPPPNATARVSLKFN